LKHLLTQALSVSLVQIIAQDASNNFDTCNFSVTVVGVPPGFDLNSLPANVTLNACDTLYDWPLPTPTGFCNPVTVSSDPVAPFLFNPGMHTVIFTATDGSATVTASFVVTVEENIAPVFTCPTSAIDVNTGGVVLSGSGFITSADSFPIGTHSLTFEATDASGNTSICSVTINVLPLEALNPMADPNPGCLNETVVLTATDIQGAAYVWTKLPGTVLGSTGSQHTIQSLTSQQAGVYTVAANVNGCLTPLDSVEVVLLLAVMPVNDVFTSSVGDLDTFNVFLNDGITDPSSYEICTLTPDPLPAGVNYLGNGLFAFQETTGENVSFTYQICYCDQSGEVATVTIMVQDDSCSFIPNIITPNDDGLNDWFTIPCLNGRNFSENSLVIYNQWGDKVFEDTGYTNDPTDATHPAWKGTLNNKEGKDLPDGVYYYIFKPSPNDPAIKGFVEIFR
jgi:gliding motility-associated-like protein